MAGPCLPAKPDWLRAIASVAITDAVTAIEAAATDAISLVILSALATCHGLRYRSRNSDHLMRWTSFSP